MEEEKQKSKFKSRLFVGVLIAALWIVPMLVDGIRDYWINLNVQAISEACSLVFEKTILSIVFGALLWLGGVYYEYKEKWKDGLILEWKKICLALRFPIIAFGGLFLLHLLIFTPAKINSQKTSQIKELENENSALKAKFENPQELRVVVEDSEARKGLKNLESRAVKSRLLSEDQKLRVIDKWKLIQPLSIQMLILAGDTDTEDLGLQLASLLQVSSHKLQHREYVTTTIGPRQRGVRVFLKSEPDHKMFDAIERIFDEIEQPAKDMIILDASMSQYDVRFEVGPKVLIQ